MRKPIESIGYVLCPTGFLHSKNNLFYVAICQDYWPCLKFLELFSHAILIHANTPVPSLTLAGEFAKDSFCLNTEVVKILSVDETKGLIVFDRLDTSNGTPLFDIKPYFPCEDRIREPRVPISLKADGLWRQDDGSSGEVTRSEPGCALEINESSDFSELSLPSSKSFLLPPCGYIRKRDGKSFIELINPNPANLQQLQEYSHIKMLWWFHRFDKKSYRSVTQVNPPYENAPKSGVFATRSPVRPNPIALTTARIIRIDIVHGMIEISGTDAFDHSPVVDILPYLPARDRVESCFVPDWLKHWPEWLDDRQENVTCSSTSTCLSSLERIRPYLQGNTSGHTPEEVFSSTFTGKPLQADEIIVEGARQNNLKNICVTIPKNKMTVITGVSGSGKSSLAFDTIYAESRRRFLDSMSGQGISASERMEKPDFDSISGLPPAISVEQRYAGRNPRSTVGTMTNIHDYLRLLFSAVGARHCPDCGEAIVPMKPDEIALLLSNLDPGTAFTIRAFRNALPAENFLTPEEEEPEKALYKKQLTAIIKNCLDAGNGAIEVELTGNIKNSTRNMKEKLVFQTKAYCYSCNRLFFDLTPSLFSFNNPESMCRIARAWV